MASKLPPRAANISGVRSSWSKAFTLTLYSSRSFITSVCPFFAARCIAVSFLKLVLETSAPNSIKRCVFLTLPPITAQRTGVKPSPSRNSRKAPLLIRKSLISSLLNLTASIRGLGLSPIQLLSGNRELTYSPKSSNHRRCPEWPSIAAKERRDWTWTFLVTFSKSSLISLNCGEFFYLKAVKIDLPPKFDAFGAILTSKLWHCKVCLDCIP